MQWTHTGNVKTHTNIFKSHSYKLFLKASCLLHHSFKCSLWNWLLMPWMMLGFQNSLHSLPSQGKLSVLAAEFWIHKGCIKLEAFRFQEHMLHSFFFFCTSFLRQIKLTFNSKPICEIRETLPSLSVLLLFKPRKVLDPKDCVAWWKKMGLGAHKSGVEYNFFELLAVWLWANY